MISGKWRWLIYLVVAWQLITTTIRAFLVPWTWNLDQVLTCFGGVALIFILVMWFAFWKRHGWAATKERLGMVRQRYEKTPSKKTFYWSLVFWIAVTIALVVYFNYKRGG